MEEKARKRWILLRLQHSLQALAIPATEQVRLFPDFVVKTDELVLDFDHWRQCAVENYGSEMTQAQASRLAAVDSHINTANASGDRSVWGETALRTHPFWERLRGIAAHALKAFGWPQDIPPSYADEYVRGSRSND